MCPCGFINCNKCATLLQDADKACVEAEVYEKFAPSTQFCCKLQIALKCKDY